MTSVLVAADNHYYRDSSGAVYVEAVFNYAFYKRYLTVFDTVYAVGRVTYVNKAPEGKLRADGPGVTFLDLEPGRGLKGFLKTWRQNKRKIRDYLSIPDCIVARVPGVVANMVVVECEAQGKRYSIEVVVDPWEYFSPEVRGGLVNRFVRRHWTTLLKKSCQKAVGVSYVTERYLQERYPCAAMRGEQNSFVAHYSSVELPEVSFADQRTYSRTDELVVAHAANTFEGNSKGHYTLFDAIRIVLDQGYRVSLICVGDGPSMGDYKEYVKKAGIADRVEFTGRLADGAEVRKRIAEADIFVFPTKAEGLPRVLLEAMAEGMPCLSTPVCGIPEILSREFLYGPDDAEGFAKGIVSFIESPDLLSRQSANNLKVARRYSSKVLESRRTAFYQKIASLIAGEG